MFLFWPLYILVVQAWSWLLRKVNAAAGAAELGAKWFSTQTQPALRPHSNHTLWNSEGKPKQQVQFIFNSKYMVMPPLLKSMFSLTNFDLKLDCCYCAPVQSFLVVYCRLAYLYDRKAWQFWLNQTFFRTWICHLKKPSISSFSETQTHSDMLHAAFQFSPNALQYKTLFWQLLHKLHVIPEGLL